MKRKTQKDKIEEYLKSGKSITPIDALEMFGCFRLGAHIFTLRGEGLKIRTDFVTNRYNTKFAKYTLEQTEQPRLF
tara:strand:- start:330 stop:557 length:228 start_codon:yes stop_codon:yes gene_type:complete